MFDLIKQMTWRDVESRYRGSVFGIFWSILTPLFMISVFTYVFSVVFQSRWGQNSTSTVEFGIILFSGMLAFNLFAEVMGRAPSIILAQPNLVKKIVFPLHLLPVVTVSSALFQTIVTFVVLLVCQLVLGLTVHWTSALVPLLLVPLILFCAGLAWFFAALGVYVRDVGQIIGPIVTAIMFLSPVFYPSSSLPAWIQPYAVNNPLAQTIEMVRNAIIFGTLPDFVGLLLSSIGGLLFAVLGFLFFQKTRKGFADVI